MWPNFLRKISSLKNVFSFEGRRLIIFSTRYIGIEKEGSKLRKALPVAWIHRTCAHTHSETWNSRIIEKTRWSDALVIPESKNKESSPEPPSKPSSPPAKKRKVVEKPKRKVPAKRSKKSKVAIPETDVEGPRIDVDLPPSVSILQDRQTSVDIARQLFSDADAEFMRQGPAQSHMNDIMWETMKRDRLKDLMEKDVARGEKLLDIERKFGDVKAGADGLMAELQKSMDIAREGTSAMETLVKRFDESQAKIKSLEAENAALATQIIDAFEKATLKARYDILKDYKAGLLDEAQIDEEIEMFEEDYPDEVRSLSTVPASASAAAENVNVEPPVQANPSEDHEARE
ncbi:hypothetical protein TIFTF001_022338 [Ficus carica]|uniref:Uncharacterized protein n=1 Tax=Ficus carica TaxID=3494 RepID=A0AA88AIH7_FICCA|nr:hypothetical protein TIFTF001_022338 [Ficus carica]